MDTVTWKIFYCRKILIITKITSQYEREVLNITTFQFGNFSLKRKEKNKILLLNTSIINHKAKKIKIKYCY